MMSFQPGSYSRKQTDLRSGSQIVASLWASLQSSMVALPRIRDGPEMQASTAVVIALAGGAVQRARSQWPRRGPRQLTGATPVPECRHMTAGEFIRLVTALGSARGVPIRFDATRGKGSHGTLYYGERFTIVKDRRKECGLGLLNKMLADLG
jgi:hypothetical protein